MEFEIVSPLLHLLVNPFIANEGDDRGIKFVTQFISLVTSPEKKLGNRLLLLKSAKINRKWEILMLESREL